MSQKLQFWQTKIFSEEVTQGFTYESLYEALKSLLRGTEIHSSEYVENYFEKVQLNYLRINLAQLEKIVPEDTKNLKYVLFDPKKTTFFMMDHQIWSGIQTLTESFIRDTINEEKQELEEKLKKTTGIAKDYDCLSNLFEKKLLFVAIF
ncbi:hypothetical protein [Microcoleus sp. POL10_C6]|uniref:hypothetical protein n=1 Tax=unclassified Microcoleus TaxID=2642155 RepID=UPI002FD1D057